MTNEQTPKYSIGDICKPGFNSHVMIIKFLDEKDKYLIKVLANAEYIEEAGEIHEYSRERFERRYTKVA